MQLKQCGAVRFKNNFQSLRLKFWHGMVIGGFLTVSWTVCLPSKRSSLERFLHGFSHSEGEGPNNWKLKPGNEQKWRETKCYCVAIKKSTWVLSRILYTVSSINIPTLTILWFGDFSEACYTEPSTCRACLCSSWLLSFCTAIWPLPPPYNMEGRVAAAHSSAQRNPNESTEYLPRVFLQGSTDHIQLPPLPWKGTSWSSGWVACHLQKSCFHIAWLCKGGATPPKKSLKTGILSLPSF